MKRWIAAAVCVLLSIGIGYSMMGGREQPEENGYKIYFREADLSNAHGGDALRPELVQLPETGSTQERIEQLMDRLLRGPQDETLSTVTPVGTMLLSAEHRGVMAIVDLSGQYSALSDVAMTIADYAIVQTLTQLPDVMLVKIMVRGRELQHGSGRTLSQRDMLFSPKEDVVSSVDAMLYALNSDGELVPTMETLNLYEGDTQVSAVVRALEKGPKSKELLPVIPPDFRVRAVWQTEDRCYVNFLSAQVEMLDDPNVFKTMCWALEKSLSSLETVEEVCFLIDGEYAQMK